MKDTNATKGHLAQPGATLFMTRADDTATKQASRQDSPCDVARQHEKEAAARPTRAYSRTVELGFSEEVTRSCHCTVNRCVGHNSSLNSFIETRLAAQC